MLTQHVTVVMVLMLVKVETTIAGRLEGGHTESILQLHILDEESLTSTQRLAQRSGNFLVPGPATPP
jgi:hypothetical protein